jgi:DNA-binding XRE family transcriptional regulator
MVALISSYFIKSTLYKVLKVIDDLDSEAKDFLDLISINVVRSRKERGFSQLKLATEIGYSNASYIGRMEIRKNNEHFNLIHLIHLIHLFKISKILDVPISAFFEPLEN